MAEIPPSWQIRAYIYGDSYPHKPHTLARVSEAELIKLSDSRFASLSDTVTPQGIMAICERRTYANWIDFYKIIKSASPTFLLLGERLADPGNIGTLIRTAAAAGAGGVVLSKGSADIYNPKVIRASAGAVLRIPILENADLPVLIPSLNVPVIAAHLKGDILPYDLGLSKGCAILIGNEAQGLSDEVSNLADYLVKLPMANEVESLNASLAGGILLYEVVRQSIAR